MIRGKAVAVDWKKIGECNLERKWNKDRRNDVKENSSYMEGLEERVWKCTLERRKRNRDTGSNYKEKKTATVDWKVRKCRCNLERRKRKKK